MKKAFQISGRKIGSILLTLCMVFTMLPGVAFAAGDIAIDATNFPDTTFRNWLLDSSNLAGIGTDGTLTAAEIASVTILNVSGESIESLAGIEHFTALTTLNCSLNWLMELPAELPAGLTNLDCCNNELTALPALPTGLQHLDCGENELTVLTALPTNLTYLRCSGNELTALTALPSGLTDLNCSDNRLTALDLSGLGSLEYCNAISQEVSLTLRGSGSSYTKTIALNNPTDLDSGLSYAGGVLTSNNAAIATSSFTVATGNALHELSGTLNLTYQTDGTPLTFTNNAAYNIPASTVNSAITNINVAPGVSGGTTPYTFSATELPAGITISTVGVISGTPTTAAEAGTATITVTDSATPMATKSITINYGAVSTEPAGTDITGSFTDANFLAEVRTELGKGASDPILDTEVASVTSLNVSNKDITSLAGIEHFTYLNELNCNNNQLMALDVSSNTALTHLYCYSNQLTALDVSSNTPLTMLYCYNNQLTELDVSSNTALTHLYCGNNQLTALDVSSNTALIDLACYNNQLTALDVRSNTALIDLYCNNNQLTALDVSSNTALTSLDCYDNQLTALDVRSNTALTSLDCYDNQLTALDVRSNTALTSLVCSNNQLTALDVSSNTALIDLVCSNNQLTALDLSGLALLQICEANNQTVSLTLTGNGSSYTKTIALNNPTNLISGLSYAGGVLTSNSTAITTASFTVDTGSADYELSGILNLTYQAGTHITGGGSSSGSTAQPAAPAADGAVKVNYTSANGTAVLSLPAAKVNDIIENSQGGAADIDLSKVSGITAAQLPKAALSAMNEAGLDITVKLPAGTITLDEDAGASILEQATGSNLSIELQPVATGSLTPAQQEAVQSGDLVLDINILSGTQKISSFDGTLSVQVAYNGPQPVAVWYLNDKGDLEKVNCTFKDGIVSFDLDHLSLYVVGQDTKEAAQENPITNVQEAGWKNPFSDVLPGAWYYDAVSYIAAKGITSGTTATTFSPDATLTRGQFITMLMRAYGISPDDNPADNFVDAGNTYYTGYLAAAKRLGITKGIGDNQFAPEQAITRQDMFTLLYNVLKGINQLPAGNLGKTLNDFTDSGSIPAYAREAMAHLVKTGIVSGSSGKLTPAETTTRAQMIQVLYNLIS
mgnify:CR=1 FL=1